MHTWHIEHRTVDPKQLTLDVAKHLIGRFSLGRAVIVADDPRVLLGQLRKKWLKEIEGLHKARASTLDAVRIVQLTQEITGMEALRFDASEANKKSVNVRVLCPGQLNDLPADCSTIYICSSCVSDIDKYIEQLPDQAVIVDYRSGLLGHVNIAEAAAPNPFGDLQSILVQPTKRLKARGGWS